MQYAENKILVEFGYTMNNNKPPIGGGYSCLLPILLPQLEHDSQTAMRVAVNTGNQLYVGDPSSVGFGYTENLPYIIYGIVDNNGTFYDYVDASADIINELHLCQPTDPVDCSGTLVDYSKNFLGVYPTQYSGPYLNFQVMVGMYFTYKNTNGEVIKINQPIQSIDMSNNRIVLKYNQADIPVGNSSPAPTAGTGARNAQGAGLATYGGNSMGMGLFNGDNNNIQLIPAPFDMQPPRRGSGLYETTKRWNNGSDLTGPIRFRSFNKRSTL